MQFQFFNYLSKTIFARDDAESAVWTVQDMTLKCLFPYDADKVIERGMRIGFTDEIGIFQPFEIRVVKTYEPDHYQEITAEHICISELTDCHFEGGEYTDVTPATILTALLSGTGWSLGNVSATNTQSTDFSMGSVWEDIRSIESDWNVWITPRVTYNSSGISGKYLDVVPANGVWRGIRLNLSKNADEVGVTIDDSMVLTALYGYGATVDDAPLKFGSVVWTQTSDHPAKPAGQTYLEDPDATALYGRGKPRFGFYQNSDVKDAQKLLELTWETLKTTNHPKVTVDCMVRDLYRLGYTDQPIRLHDTALVDISETGTQLALTIINLDVDLLDPTATRPTIGDYIPNIIYIDRENSRGGGGGGRISGQRGIKPKNWAYTFGNWANEISKNTEMIAEQGTQIASNTANIATNTTDIAKNTSDISTHTTQIATNTSNISSQGSTIATHTTQIGNLQQAVTDQQDEIDKYADGTTPFQTIAITSSSFTVHTHPASWLNDYVLTGITVTMPSITLSTSRDFVWANGSMSNLRSTPGQIVTAYTAGSVTNKTGKTIYYLGRRVN